MTIQDLRNMVEATERWTATDEGQKAMEETQKTVEQTTAFLSTERMVDGQTLQTPLGF
ncbi:MAG TPA: hypothetical protein PKD55_23885 [Bellilinea sp.]|nr:hypothetical protein [Bellilinea sp.]